MTLATAFDYFANSLWQVPLLALCCGCALRLMRASARVQYAVCIATLLLCVALPWRGANPPASAVVTSSASDVYATGEFLHPLPAPSLPFYAIRIRPHTRDLLAELYLVLMVLSLLRLSTSHLAMRRLIKASTTPELSPAAVTFIEECDANVAQLRVPPASHQTPMVAGVLRPVILLPESLLTGAPEPLRAVLAHEVAHLRRRDTLVNLLLRVVAIPIAYHPATAFLHRRIQHARELLCDAVAARALPSPAAYAHVLLTLAQQLIHSGSDTSHSAVGLFARTSKPLHKNHLEERIMNLVTPPTPLPLASRALRLAAGVALFAAAAFTVTSVRLTPAVLAAAPQASPSAPQSAPAVPAPTEVQPSFKPARRTPSPVLAKDSQQPATELDQAASELRNPQLQRDLDAAATVDTAEMRKQLEAAREQLRAAMRAQLNSPEFKRQIADASAAAARAALESESYRKQLDELKKQLNSPEFKQQIKAATEQAVRAHSMTPEEVTRLVAESKAQAMLGQALALNSAAAQQEPAPQRVSAGVMAGQVLSKVQPVYPPEAKAAGITGSVILHAIIGKDGMISSLQLVSGPDVLAKAAWDAVKQWTYQPYLLNGQPTAVDTTITINFSMNK